VLVARQFASSLFRKLTRWAEKSSSCNVSTSLPPPTLAQESLVDQGLLIVEASRSHSHTPHSVGLLWKSDRLDA